VVNLSHSWVAWGHVSSLALITVFLLAGCCRLGFEASAARDSSAETSPLADGASDRASPPVDGSNNESGTTLPIDGGHEIGTSDLGSPDLPPAMDGGSLGGQSLWSKQYGGPESDHGMSVALDSNGNIYITGVYRNLVDFGGGTLPSFLGNNIFIASFTASGAHRWSKGFGGSDTESGSAVAVDGNNNVYLTGHFRASVNFGGTAATSAGLDDIFLMSFTSSGTQRWVQTFGGGGNDVGNAVVVDSSNNLYLLSSFQQTVSFGSSSFTTGGLTDSALVSFTSTGGFRWAKQLGASGTTVGRSAALGGGYLYIAGSFYNDTNLGGALLTSKGAEDAFLASYSLAGAHRWSMQLGGKSDERGSALAADVAGNTYLTGEFSGTTNLGGSALVATGVDDIFLASYSSTGSHRWSKGFGGASYNEGLSIAVGKNGAVYFTGDFQGMMDMGGSALVSQGTYEIFVASFSSAGAHRWSRRFGGASMDYGYGIAASDAIYATGIFLGTADLGGSTPAASAGAGDVFLLKLQP
jgi:hypothetical protein